MLRVLNLYAGIGGNRKLWGNDIEVTAIEFNDNIAKIYKDLFPNDNVIVTDAHKYLEEHYKEFDFIWSSPPCPSHSCIRKIGCNPKKNGKPSHKPIYPDMKLYEEIIFLQGYVHDEKTKWVVENVMPYYEPLIEAKKLDRHLFWSNFPLVEKEFKHDRKHHMNLNEFKESLGVDLDKYTDIDKRAVYRNCVNSELGKYIFDSAFSVRQLTL